MRIANQHALDNNVGPVGGAEVSCKHRASSSNSKLHTQPTANTDDTLAEGSIFEGGLHGTAARSSDRQEGTKLGGGLEGRGGGRRVTRGVTWRVAWELCTS